MQATNIPDVLMSPVLRNNHDFWGVNTMIASPSGAFAGVGFAIPSDTVNRIVQFPGILVKLDFSWPIMPFVICTPLDRYTCFFFLKSMACRQIIKYGRAKHAWMGLYLSMDQWTERLSRSLEKQGMGKINGVLVPWHKSAVPNLCYLYTLNQSEPDSHTTFTVTLCGSSLSLLIRWFWMLPAVCFFRWLPSSAMWLVHLHFPGVECGAWQSCWHCRLKTYIAKSPGDHHWRWDTFSRWKGQIDR